MPSSEAVVRHSGFFKILAMSILDHVAIAIFASDGMKIPALSIEESWAQSPEMHIRYRERALVFLKVYGERMAKFADGEIAKLGDSGLASPAK